MVNAGNANVLNGKHGDAAVRIEVTTGARLLETPPEEIFVASTGVIGEPLQAEKIAKTLPNLYGYLAPDGWQPAAEAIMTTDTFRQGCSSPRPPSAAAT